MSNGDRHKNSAEVESPLRDKVRFVFGVFTISLIGLLWFLRWSTGPQGLGDFGLAIDIADFSIQSVEKQIVNGKKVTFVEGKGPQLNLNLSVIEDMGEADFVTYRDQKNFELMNQFSRGASPYPGAISDKLECPEEMKPKAEITDGELESSVLIKTFANSRQQMGVCEASEKAFDVALKLLHCKTKKIVLDLTLFSPKTDFNVVERARKAHCVD